MGRPVRDRKTRGAPLQDLPPHRERVGALQQLVLDRRQPELPGDGPRLREHRPEVGPERREEQNVVDRQEGGPRRSGAQAQQAELVDVGVVGPGQHGEDEEDGEPF